MKIATMSEPRFDLNVLIRSTPRAKLALDRVVAAMRASNIVRWKGRRPTQEAVFSAVWLWLEGMDPATIELPLAHQMMRLEAIMRGDPDPGVNTPLPERAENITAEVEIRKPGEPPRGRKGRKGA